MKKRMFLFIAIGLMCSLLFCFDGKRKGFLMGAGLGISNLQLIEEYSGSIKEEDSKSVNFISQTKLGWGFNEKVEVFYTCKNIWGKNDNTEDNKIFATGLMAVGTSYFFKDLAISEYKPAFYVTGGVGYAFWRNPFEEETNEIGGFGIFAGGGYEFAKHYSIEINLLRGYTNSKKHDADFKGVSVTLNALAF